MDMVKLRGEMVETLRKDPELKSSDARERFAPSLSPREFALHVFGPAKRRYNNTYKVDGPDMRGLLATFSEKLKAAQSASAVSEAFEAPTKRFDSDKGLSAFLDAANKLHGANVERKEVEDYLDKRKVEREIIEKLEKLAKS